MQNDPNRKKNSSLREKAEEILAGKTDETPDRSTADAETLVHELQVHQIELEMQNDELRRTEAGLAESRQEYADLYDFAPVGYLTFDEQGLITQLNLTAAGLLGTERKNLVNKPFNLFVSPEFQQAFFAHRHEVLKNSAKLSSFLNLKRKDGSSFHAQLDSIATGGDGRRSIRSILTDIAERKQADEALKKAHDELERRVQKRTAQLRQSEETAYKRLAEIESYYDTAPVGLTVLDENLRYVRINERLAEMNGVPAAEHIGRTVRDIVPALADQFERMARQIFESGEPVRNIEHKGATAAQPGVQRTWLGSWHPLKNAAGHVTGITGVVQEVTEQRYIEEQLRQAQKMEAVGTLSGGIAHDFNNILAAIIGFTEMVIDDVSDNPHVRQKMERVLKAGLRGRDLVKQILAFSRKAEVARNEISLTPLVNETYALLRASLPTTIQMTFVRTTTEDHVLADSTQLQQVLMNLATNAADAMRENGGQLTIELSSVTFPPGSALPDPDLEPGTYVKLTVKDTGAGMTEAIRQRIFEPFFTTKEPGKGTGMGLAVVYGIVKAHGGAVTVQSEIGQGSIFGVLLPQAKKPEPGKEETTTLALPTGTERILFVDDEEMLVEMARGMLKNLGYYVSTAASGAEAWDLFLEDPSRFDLIITDQTMPDVTGVTLARKILRVRKEMPIILCTGYSETVSAEKAKEVGIREFVMKPMVKKELAEAIRRVLDGGKE